MGGVGGGGRVDDDFVVDVEEDLVPRGLELEEAGGKGIAGDGLAEIFREEAAVSALGAGERVAGAGGPAPLGGDGKVLEGAAAGEAELVGAGGRGGGGAEGAVEPVPEAIDAAAGGVGAGGDEGMGGAKVGDLEPGVYPGVAGGGIELGPGGEGLAGGAAGGALGRPGEVREEALGVARGGRGGKEREEERLALEVAAGHLDEFLPARAVAEGEEAGLGEGVEGGVVLLERERGGG